MLGPVLFTCHLRESPSHPWEDRELLPIFFAKWKVLHLAGLYLQGTELGLAQLSDPDTWTLDVSPWFSTLAPHWKARGDLNSPLHTPAYRLAIPQ